MDNLTAAEKKILNNISQVLDSGVKLGDKIAEIIGLSGEVGTPVNAVAAKETLTLTGVVVHGETVTINNPAVAGTDVYEFLTDEAQTKTEVTNIAVDITASAVKASCVLTMDTQPTAGDTLTIGEKTYIFVPVGTANGVGEISIGADLAGAQAALVAAINGTDGVNAAHPSIIAGAFNANASIISALIGGTIGNLIATTETFTAVTNVFASATLTLGADCTAANAIIALVAAITANDTQGATGTDGDGDTLVLTADVAGIVGNAIVIGETMANATFTAGATHLSGGIDGTVAEGTKFMMDESYLYICLNGNTTAGTNWRRILIGNAY
jgi:hypothetical protein